MGCADEVVSEPVHTSGVPTRVGTGCVVVTDDYGEREVCDTQYYYVNGGVVYWDAHFNTWIGPGAYWSSGGWHQGFYPGWHGYYGHGFYHSHEFYHGAHRDGYRNTPMRGGGYHGTGHGGHR